MDRDSKSCVIIVFCFILLMMLLWFSGCESGGSFEDRKNTLMTANNLQANQPTPTDIEYSLERYNLIRRAYWVNGMREKALTLPCPITKPFGYVILLTESGTIVGKFVVDGKISSLNSFLTPDSSYYSVNGGYNYWLADVDGSYGENDNGIFFFTPDGKYIEWSGIYLYSDIPFEIEETIIKNVKNGGDSNGS